jgi:Cdc6-like AAA superfamily ATPase
VSIRLVESEIRRFLRSDEPEVISISGRWGVGKTFAWTKYFQDAKKNSEITLKRYSYVSLFGINSLDELKFTVFENTVNSSDTGADLSIETLESKLRAPIEGFARRSVGVFQRTRYVENYIGGFIPMFFSLVKNSVVCVDDFERRGKNLDVRDVLGLVNNLKELRRCKVCLILNDEALEQDEADYRKYVEKVVDANLKFDPSAEECAGIALTDGTQVSKLLAEHCIKLGISNIRVIKKIERSLRQLEPIVATLDPQVLRQAAHSLALFGWSMHEPTKAPDLEFLKARRREDFLGISRKESVSEKEGAWNALLDAYEFASMDEFDLALLAGVQNGFFDLPLVSERASELDGKIKAGNLDAAFNSAWRMFHDSFDDNQEEVLAAMFKSFSEGVRYITPMNMSSTIAVFKELGRSSQALEMLKHYIESRSGEPEIFDLRNNPFGEDVRDPDVRKAFAEKYASVKRQKMDPATVLLRIADTGGWNQEDIRALAALSVDDYRKIFKANRGKNVRTIVNACLQFDRIGNATPEMSAISKNAKDALRIIGRESPINARRVKSYGVDVDSPSPQTEA